MNSTKPSVPITPSDTAVASGQPSQLPPVRTRAAPLASTLTRLIQRIASPAEAVGTDGAGAGVGATGTGVTGSGAGAGDGVVGAGVDVPGTTPSICVGIRTMN